MSDLPRPDAVLFDLDGTLVDSVQRRIEAWQAALAELGVTVSAQAAGDQIGRDGAAVALELAASGGVHLDQDAAAALDSRAGELFGELNAVAVPAPGVPDVVSALDRLGIPWAIATSSRPAQVASSVAALGLSRPPRIVDGSAVENAKPAPDLLLLGARQLAVEPGRCWYVGDAVWDMQAAVAAGMVAVAVTAGSASDEPALRRAGAADVLPTLAHLADRLTPAE